MVNSDIVAMMVRQGSPEFTEGLTMILRLAQDERGVYIADT
jgi:hypothetical protein